MAKKDDIALWSDLFKNPNYKPTIIGGVSRGGTTWVYRNLLQYKTTLETVALEEYFHQFYKFTFGDRIQIDRDTMNKALAEKRVINDPLDLNWRTEIGVRYKELRKRNRKIKFQDVKKALRIRNISDINRKNSPLLKHRDSIEIDTGKLNKQAMLSKMSKYIERVVKHK